MSGELPSTPLALISGPAVHKALGAPDVVVFRYALNRAVFGVLLVTTVGGLLGAAALYNASTLWLVALLVGATAGIAAAYAHEFAAQQVVAVSQANLLIGRERAAWLISWSLLDADTMGLRQLRSSPLAAALRIEVGGQRIRLHLYNPLVHLNGIEPLMAEVLARLPRSADEEE